MKKIRNPFRRRRDGSSLVHVGSSIVVGSVKLKVVSKEAEGGSAFIFKVKESTRGTVYALKQLILADSDEIEMQYVYEKSTLEALKGHPNVIRLYHATVVEGEDGHREGWMLLEYCAVSLVRFLTGSEKLHDYGSQRLALPECDTLTIVASVSAALTALHTLSPSPLAHRDIKAENVLLGADGKWKLCDFGSVSNASGIISSAAAAGREQLLIDRTTTPNYRPPEMWDVELSQKPIGLAVDMWMLGCLLYRVCFGAMPFADAAKLQILQGRFSVPQQFASSAAGDVRFFISLINRLLVVEPAARITAAETRTICTERLSALKAMAGGGSEQPSAAVASSSSSNSMGAAGHASDAGIGDAVGHGEGEAKAETTSGGSKIKLPKLGRMLGARSSGTCSSLAATATTTLSWSEALMPSSSAPDREGPAERGRHVKGEIQAGKHEDDEIPVTGVDNGGEHYVQDSSSATSAPEQRNEAALETAAVTIQKLTMERDAMAAKIAQLEALVVRQQQEITYLKSHTVETSSSANGAAAEKQVNSPCKVETGWATGWNSPAPSVRALPPPLLDTTEASMAKTTPSGEEAMVALRMDDDEERPMPETVDVDDFFGMKEMVNHQETDDRFDRFNMSRDDTVTNGGGARRGSNSASSSDGGFDENINFSISSRSNSLIEGSRARPDGAESSLLDDPVPPQRGHDGGNSNMTDLLSLCEPSSSMEGGSIRLIDTTSDESVSRPLRSSSNPFCDALETTQSATDADAGGAIESNHEGNYVTQHNYVHDHHQRRGSDQKLQELVDRSLSHNRRRSSDNFRFDSVVDSAAGEAVFPKKDSSGRPIHGRSLSHVADVSLLGDLSLPLDTSPAHAGFESESTAFDEDDEDHHHHPEGWSTVSL